MPVILLHCIANFHLILTDSFVKIFISIGVDSSDELRLLDRDSKMNTFSGIVSSKMLPAYLSTQITVE